MLQVAIIQKILDLAGPYAYWMVGFFIFSVALFLVPSNIVVPIINNYSSPGVVPALSMLQAYYRAVNVAQILYGIFIAIAAGAQIFFLAKTIKQSTRFLVGAIPLFIAIFVLLAGILMLLNVQNYGKFLDQVSADIRQIENGSMETARIHISPRPQANISNRMGSPLDAFIAYESPLQIIRGIRPGEGLGWEDFRVPLSLDFSRNTARPFDERRSIAHNLEHAQLYKITFTSGQRLVYAVERVAP